MNLLNNLLLGLMGVVIIVVIYFLVKLLRVDSAKFDALKPIETEVKVERPEKRKKNPFPPSKNGHVRANIQYLFKNALG